MANKVRANYIKRPLNDAEREFAALPENHNLIYEYMKRKGLDTDNFYDELILDYLTAVKQYVTERPELQIKFPFKQVLFQQLNGRMMHYWREYHNKTNTLEREALRLDYEYENQDQNKSSRIEPWWIDPMQNVERYVIEKEFLRDVHANVHRYAEPDLLELIINMRCEGWSNYDIARKAIVSLSDYCDWGVREVAQLIKILTRTYNSAMKRLFRDTKEYGNIDQFYEWQNANEM